MNRSILLCLMALVAAVQGFTVVPKAKSVTTTTQRFMSDDDMVSKTKERGVSVDQDGKSNVWAIEPKMEVSNKSSEEQSQTTLIAGVGIAGAIAFAALILTNLPDPNQF